MRYLLPACFAFAALVVVALPREALAQTLAGEMTCQQAKAQYEASGRLYVLRGAEILPIYGGVPVSRQNELRCERFDPKILITVRTADRATCTVGYRCQ